MTTRSGSSAGSGFLPPGLLEGLGGLDLIARTLVHGLVSGLHRSPFRGTGEEFARHRAYQQGDEVRHVDWKLYGRTDRLFVREYRERSNLRAYLVVDHSLSMGYAGADGVSKLRYASYAAAALAYLMVSAGDAVGLATFGGSDDLRVPARNRRGHLHEIFLHLERLAPGGAGGAARALDQAGDALRRAGRIVLISDLLAEEKGALEASVGRLRARGDEVVVLHVLTPEETGERPPQAGLFFDPEHPSGEIPADPGSDPGYVERVRTHFAGVEQRLRGFGAEFVSVTTAVPVERALLSWLSGRRA